MKLYPLLETEKMKNPIIDAIIFDIGGTLRANQSNDGSDPETAVKLQTFIGDTSEPRAFAAKLRQREAEYRRWCQRTLIEFDEADLWSHYMLPETPAGFVREHAVELNIMWRESNQKVILPDAVETLRTLAARGYAMGIISNTTSSVEGPKLLEENNLTSLFSSIILSSTFGRRKPHPSLFLTSAKELNVLPERCAYVGDQMSRDLVGPRQAGYALVAIIDRSGYNLVATEPDEDISRDLKMTVMQPDYKIGTLSELLKIFPERNHHPASIQKPIQMYDAALSTMWSVDQKLPFNQTFEMGRKAGFARFELNHKVPPELFTQWDSNRFYISTVHDPCPAVYTNEDLKVNDFMISSLDEKRRIKGMDITKASIDLACSLGARSVVIHPGMIQADRRLETQQRALFESGRKDTPEFVEVTRELIRHRASLAPAHFEQTVKSMRELIQYASGTGLDIGLENRYHYYDIPMIDEMQVLLDLCDDDWYGFQYDCGHGHTLSVLGLCDHKEWLDRFGHRMVGTHLHDVVGIKDHQLPGTGDVDFGMIAPYLPLNAHRTLELSPNLTIEELHTALEVLEHFGCISKV